jgi:futalosine hydrolase
MKILIVSATEKEIFPLTHSLHASSGKKEQKSRAYNNLDIDVLVTGIGGVFTTFNLTQKLSQSRYDFIINAGIAGSFLQSLKVGDVVHIQKDQFADLGIEDEKSFSTLFEKGFIPKSSFPFQDGVLFNSTKFNNLKINELKKVSAITVNTTHGKEESIKFFKEKFDAEIETMEGAAFFYVCMQNKVSFVQIRSISNYVKKREIAQWNIPLAIENLNKKLFEVISVLDNDQKI